MADRVKLNNINRKLHYYASLVILVFVLFYTLSGFIMTKYKWLGQDNIKTTVHRHALNYRPDTADLAKFGEEIRQRFGLQGRLEYKRNPNHSISFVVYRPGIRNEITVRPKLDTLVIKRIENISLHQISTRLHRTHGYSGGWKYFIWALLVDITAVAVIVFVVTGLIIWYKHRKRYKWGLAVVIPTLIFALLMFIYFI